MRAVDPVGAGWQARLRTASLTLVGSAAMVGALMTGQPAAAEPSTTLAYSANASATRFNGYAFDACAAPSLATMSAWRSSPYTGVGVYVGGPNRTCSQPNLTAAWVTSISRSGWRIIPIYMGRQAPCTFRVNGVTFTASSAAASGTGDAADAVAKAKALGMRSGSAIYGDMEHYDASDSACRTAVLRYVSAWTKELHRQGYLAGVYAHLNSGAKHLSEAYSSSTYARPDALWIARWDENSALTGWPNIGAEHWSSHQRGKQYRGDHDERHGGVTVNIDSDRFDAPVATVAHPYTVTSGGALNGRDRPSASGTLVRTYASGASVNVVCQTSGSTVGSTKVWDKLTDGNYVSDAYLNTPSAQGYSPLLPRCSYPFQVTTTTLNARSGPGSTYALQATLSSGGLAWISCQRAGSSVAGSSVWDRLLEGTYVTDAYVATPSASYSPPIPRC